MHDFRFFKSVIVCKGIITIDQGSNVTDDIHLDDLFEDYLSLISGRSA